MNDFDDFINEIIDAKGYSSLDPETKKYMTDELRGLLIEQINRRILEQLPDEKLDELEQKLDAGEMAPEQVQHFAAECGVDVAKTVTEVMIFFRGFYAGAGEN